eukprot:scaffold28640_cov75-Phaeocystis_antarctica.AAC.3
MTVGGTTQPQGEMSGSGSPPECVEQPRARRTRPRRPRAADLWHRQEGGRSQHRCLTRRRRRSVPA